MRKLSQLFLMYLMSAFALFAQFVPADKAAETAKPFLGIWNAMSCQEVPEALRFTIELKDSVPVLSIMQYFDATGLHVLPEPVELKTDAFLDFGEGRVVIDFTQGPLLLSVVSVDEDSLYGDALYRSDGFNWDVWFKRVKSPELELPDFFLSTVGACGKTKKTF